MYLLIPVTASVAAGPGDEEDLVLRGERRDLQGDARRDAAGEDLVALADQVAWPAATAFAGSVPSSTIVSSIGGR